MRRHLAAEHDAAAQRDHGGDLAQRKVRIAPVMAAIDDLDADRTGIDVFLAGPGRHAGMPGALGFRDALHDAAVLQHDVMRRYVGARGAQLRDRALDVGHAGVVQHDHVGQAALVAVAIVRRRDDVGGDRGIGGECLHVRVGPGKREGALTLRIKTSRRERTERHRTTQTGQENGNGTSSRRTAFTIPLRCRRRNARSRSPLRILAECVREASPAAERTRGSRSATAVARQIASSPINAFLTLTAVTKW